VIDEIWAAAPQTIVLVGTATALSMVLGIMMGISAGWRRGTAKDRLWTSTSITTWSTPDFWLGMILLTVFSVRLGLFPTGGIEDPSAPDSGLGKLLDQLWHMTLPCLTLAIAYVGEFALIMRSSILDVMREDYLTLARAKGLRDAQVRDRHAVRNALLPSTALIAINFGFVLSGAIAVETIYSWPGLGRLTYDALNAPDLPLLQGLFLVFSAAVIFFNLVSDLLYAYLDPRVRTA
jgi:peptide/nickel transport system permease protein